MVQRYEQTRKLQWYKRGAAYEREAYTDGGFQDQGRDGAHEGIQ